MPLFKKKKTEEPPTPEKGEELPEFPTTIEADIRPEKKTVEEPKGQPKKGLTKEEERLLNIIEEFRKYSFHSVEAYSKLLPHEIEALRADAQLRIWDEIRAMRADLAELIRIANEG